MCRQLWIKVAHSWWRVNTVHSDKTASRGWGGAPHCGSVALGPNHITDNHFHLLEWQYKDMKFRWNWLPVWTLFGYVSRSLLRWQLHFNTDTHYDCPTYYNTAHFSDAQLRKKIAYRNVYDQRYKNGSYKWPAFLHKPYRKRAELSVSRVPAVGRTLTTRFLARTGHP